MGMDSDRLTPVLIIAFNRPKTLESLLLDVEKLPEREIWISIDGPRDKLDEEKVRATIDLAQSWLKKSKHSVRIFEQTINQGIYKHCMRALSQFFKEFNVGIILEDDIQFRPEFIGFVDQNQIELVSGKFWSICGHNPGSDLSDLAEGCQVEFLPSHVHTIWGWASSRHSVLQFLEVAEERDSDTVNDSINAGAQLITKDPFVKLGIRRVWQSKMQRALNTQSGGGWDNFWVIAGWRSGLPSLMSTYSLSRENPLQNEGQSHPHKSVKKNWPLNRFQLEIGPTSVTHRKLSDVALLDVWGITRIYCWLYFLRIYRWKINADS